MDNTLFFEAAGDERGTPKAFFDTLNTEFTFDLDAAASELNHKCDLYFGSGGAAFDALREDWAGMTTFLNPPYSIAGAFVAKAKEESIKGATVVLLLPARTDTKWWHAHIWDKHAMNTEQTYRERTSMSLRVNELPAGDWRSGVECRFLSGRLSFELQVPQAMRDLVKTMMTTPSDGSIEKILKAITLKTGLPKMAIEGILKDWPDEDLLANAPFPSCVVIFRMGDLPR